MRLAVVLLSLACIVNACRAAHWRSVADEAIGEAGRAVELAEFCETALRLCVHDAGSGCEPALDL